MFKYCSCLNSYFFIHLFLYSVIILISYNDLFIIFACTIIFATISLCLYIYIHVSKTDGVIRNIDKVLVQPACIPSYVHSDDGQGGTGGRETRETGGTWARARTGYWNESEGDRWIECGAWMKVRWAKRRVNNMSERQEFQGLELWIEWVTWARVRRGTVDWVSDVSESEAYTSWGLEIRVRGGRRLEWERLEWVKPRWTVNGMRIKWTNTGHGVRDVLLSLPYKINDLRCWGMPVEFSIQSSSQ